MIGPLPESSSRVTCGFPVSPVRPAHQAGQEKTRGRAQPTTRLTWTSEQQVVAVLSAVSGLLLGDAGGPVVLGRLAGSALTGLVGRILVGLEGAGSGSSGGS